MTTRLRKSWVFDMDGTLADSDHRKHHLLKKDKDWDLWYKDMDKDPVNEDVAQFTHVARKSGIPVTICTGRLVDYSEVTEKWLEDNEIYYDYLLMRPSGDFRDDTIVKAEMICHMELLGLVPEVIWDDRDRVVKMWRDKGYTCFQVKYGDF